MRKIIYFIFCAFLIFPTPSFSASAGNVVINEIAWMGTEIQNIDPKNWWRYEWLELYNNTLQEIYLSGWKLELYARNWTGN